MHRNPETDGEFIFFQRRQEVERGVFKLANHPRIKAIISAQPPHATKDEQLRSEPYNISAPSDQLQQQRMGRKLIAGQQRSIDIASSQQYVDDVYDQQPPQEGDAAQWVDLLGQEDSRAA